MSWWRAKPLRRMAVLVVAGSVIAACGSSSSGSGGGNTASPGGSSTSPSAATTPSGPTGSVIKIGVAAAETGVGASLWAQAAKIPTVWADYTNAHGGIAGHKVQVIVEDSKSDPAAGLAVAHDLVQNKHVVAMLTLDTQAETAIAQYLQKAKIPLLGMNFDSTITSKPNVFNVNSSVLGVASGTVLAAKLAGKTKFGLMYCTESPACAQVRPLYQGVASQIGVKYTGDTPISASAASYTAQCLSFIDKGATDIEVDEAESAQVRVAADCLKQGYKGTFSELASEVDIPAYKSVPGTTWIGTLNAFPWWINAAPVKTYRDAVQQYAPSLNIESAAPAGAWTSLLMFTRALSAATGAVTPASVSAAYATVKNETLNGLLPSPVSFVAGKPTTSPPCFWIFKYVSGQQNPTLLRTAKSGNGASGSLASSCMPSS
jgi:branched-chain amino acid transport system substrate-binding protein